MTDTFTIEQIEAAMVMAGSIIDPADVIAELTRPVWKPEVGEVVCNTFDHDCLEYYNHVEHGAVSRVIRPLTPDEVPALKVAIDNLKAFTVWDESVEQTRKDAIDALARIKELTGG